MTIVQKKPSRPPGRISFFSFLEVFLNPKPIEAVKAAYALSKGGHAKQKRKDGSRFFDHPKAAAWIYVHELGGRDVLIILLLILHDMQEDTYLLSFFRIRLNFGQETALDLFAVTKIEGETFEESMTRVVERGLRTIIAKFCDRLHNLRTLGVCSLEMQHEQIEETEIILMPILLPALRAFGGKWIEVADLLEEKMNEAIKAIKDQW
jgi:(p)ppGpp synthase/HD superfamily hydrolase